MTRKVRKKNIHSGYSEKEYSEGGIDMSYWHLHTAEREKLYPDDLNNPVWNEAAHQSKTETAD